MKGTEKQIRWAENIKESAYETVNGNIKILNERLEKYPNWNSLKNDIKGYEKVREILDMFFSQCDDAAKIIEKRFILDGETLINLAHEYTSKMNK